MIRIKNIEASMAWRSYRDAKDKVTSNIQLLRRDKKIYMNVWKDSLQFSIIGNDKKKLKESIELCRYWKRIYKQYQAPNSKKYFKLNKTIKFK